MSMMAGKAAGSNGGDKTSPAGKLKAVSMAPKTIGAGLSRAKVGPKAVRSKGNRTTAIISKRRVLD